MSMLVNAFFAKGGGVGFPSSFSAWARFKANDQSEGNGSNVAQLTDQSGNARHGTQSDSAKLAIMRTNVVNGKKVFDFTASAPFYELPDMSGFTQGEIFYILKCDLNDNTDGFSSGLGQFGTDTQNSHYEYNDGSVYEHFGLSARVNFTDSAFNTAVYHCYNVNVNATTLKAFQNNVSRASITLSGVPTTKAFNSAPIIGGNRGGTYLSNFNGRFAEIVICSTILTTQQRFDLHSYFNYEYGLSMTP